MKLLVVGSGGREHAMAWKLAQSPRVQKVFVAPGNGGTALENGLENVAIAGIPELLDFCRKESVYLTVVGPEAPLAAGIVDAFTTSGAPISAIARSASYRVSHVIARAVGTPASIISAFVNAFDVSSIAAAFVGPKMGSFAA